MNNSNISIQITDRGLGVVVKSRDGVSAAEYVDAHIAFLRQNLEAFKSVRYWYSDCTDATSVQANSASLIQLSEIAQEATRINPTLVVAVSAPQARVFSLARLWESLAEYPDWQTQVFRDPAAARAWLRETLQSQLTFS